jgi:hypothetical protein
MTWVIEEPKRNRSHCVSIVVRFAAVVLQPRVRSRGAFQGLLKATRAGVSRGKTIGFRNVSWGSARTTAASFSLVNATISCSRATDGTLRVNSG